MFNEVENLYRSGYKISEITIIMLSKKEYSGLSFSELQNNICNIAFTVSYNDSVNKK